MRWTVLSLVALGVVAAMGCLHTPEVTAPRELPRVSSGEARFHMLDGRLYVLSSWSLSGADVTGTGGQFEADRSTISVGAQRFPAKDIAVVVTDHAELATGAIPLMIVSAGAAVLTVMCAANPKACFGSCPTFYTPAPEGWRLQAEGYSSSVARSLELDDLDDLPDVRDDRGFVTLAMRNEALETHFTRQVELWSAAGPPGTRVFASADEHLHALGDLHPPTSCSGGEAQCDLLAARDGRELVFASDGEDLAARTTVTLEFPPPRRARAGLVLTLRNTLMSTFVLYHLIALHGREMPELIARLERKEPSAMVSALGFGAALGGIDVTYRQKGAADRTAPRVPYIGPIARSTLVVPLDVERPDEPVEITLSMSKAHFKIDAASLGPILEGDIRPAIALPEVTDAGRLAPREVEASLRGEGDRVVTLPGDEVRMRFKVEPSSGSRAYFLKTRGYYYEWVRGSWLKDENANLAARYMADPRAALRELAPAYKQVEPQMDAIFEASRFVRRAR